MSWEDGTLAGQKSCAGKAMAPAPCTEAHTCAGDPNVAANSTDLGSFTGGKAVLNGFTPGTIIWGRVRKIGTGGEVDDWSDPAQIRAN